MILKFCEVCGCRVSLFNEKWVHVQKVNKRLVKVDCEKKVSEVLQK